MEENRNKIVVFANQKGGVGKTSLCVLFANYLFKHDYPVCIVDADLQKSVWTKRQDDDRNYPEEQKYNVTFYDIPDNVSEVQDVMAQLKTMDGIVLIDTPGNIGLDGLIPIYSNADVIICPYCYEAATLSSTGVFIQILEKLKQSQPQMKDTKIVFVPNRIKNGTGTREEKAMWEQVDKTFEAFGTVSPKVRDAFKMTRYNTVDITTEQEIIVKDAFKYIIKKMKN